jgi:hypothetical protein
MRLAVLSVYLTLATLSLSANGREFSHSRDLPPLKLASADLDSILLKAQSLIAAANGPSGEQDSARESVKLGVSDKEIEIPHFSRASSVAFPKQLFRFSYAYYRPDKPISSVTLDFSDYSRRVSVTGEAADQVQSITNLLENDLLRHSTRIGGAMFRRVVGVGLSVALLVSLIVSSAYWWNTRSHSTSGMLVCSVLALLLLLFVPWQRYLAGFALYQSYSPFLLIRYAAPIFFLSLIATILSIPYCIFFRDGDGKHNHLCKQPLLCTTLPCRLIGAKHAEANRWGCWWCSCLVSHRQCRQSRIARDVARLFRSRSRQDFTVGMLVARLLLGAISSLCAGFVAAWVTNWSVLAIKSLAGLLLIMFLPVITLWERFPPWHHVVFLASLVVVTLLGGLLYPRRGSRPSAQAR